MSIAVALENVSIKFLLYHQRNRSFQDALVNVFNHRSSEVEEFWALRDVTFEVGQGEAVGIVGQNGSGKSTILKLLTKILEPTTGKVSVHGKVSALIELGAGFHPDLTGRENIYLNGSILGFSRKQMDKRFADIVDFSELERFIDTPVKHYSSGMYARLGFSVAISVDPDILIIDEVLAVGDERFQRKSFDRIAEFRRHGKTIILVSHGLDTVEQLCDRVIWLQQGQVAAAGPAVETLRHYITAGRTPELPASSDAEREAEEATAFERLGAQVHGVSLRGADGRPSEAFRSGDTVVARLGFVVEDPSDDYVLAVDVRRRDGLLISRLTHTLRITPFVDSGSSGELEIRIPRIQLVDGEYDLLTSLRRINRVDSGAIRDAHRIDFRITDSREIAGLVQLPIQWPEDDPPALVYREHVATSLLLE